MKDNREHWPTLTHADVRDRLALYGFSEEKARALQPRSALRMMRELDALNERLTNCDIAALVAEMKKQGAELVPVGDDHKLRTRDLACSKWVASVLPTLQLRKEEIVAAWDDPPPAEVCGKCYSAVTDRDAASACCEFILSCPYLPEVTT